MPPLFIYKISDKDYVKTIFIFFTLSALAESLPSPEEMQALKPTSHSRTRIHDTVARTQSHEINQVHDKYSSPQVLNEMQKRLERVRQTNDPTQLFTEQEYEQLQKNLIRLKEIESKYFNKWYRQLPMNIAVKVQRLYTTSMSPKPIGQRYDAHYQAMMKELMQNPLFKAWTESLPLDLISPDGPRTWGDLLQKFNTNEEFRTSWIKSHPSTLPIIKELTESWTIQDLSIESVTLYNQGQHNEYWVIKRKAKPTAPNPFQAIITGDIEALIDLEYSHDIYFNRLQKITMSSNEITYHLQSVEKGRSMELTSWSSHNGLQRETFPGANFFRATKIDEIPQINLVKAGTLNIFLGMRTIQLDQLQKLMKINPALVMAVGQVGFSLTGGRAQAISVRTDDPQQQLNKMTAALIDIIDFSQTKDVDRWVKKQSNYLLRAITTGVGTGGAVSKIARCPLQLSKFF